MKLPGFKRIFENDFTKEEQSLVSKLASILNQGIENIYLALNKRLSLRDNIQCTVRDIEIQVDNTGKPTITSSFRLDDSLINQNIPVIGCIIINVENLSIAGRPVISAPFCQWVQINNGIQITNITGLEAGQLYRIRIVAFN